MPTKYTMILDDAVNKELERLRATWQLGNRANVYDLALRVLAWSTEQQVNGYEFGRFKDGDFQPLLMPHTLDKSEWTGARAA